MLTFDTIVEGYLSDSSADVTLDFTLLNEGGLPVDVQSVHLSCLDESQVMLVCGEETAVPLTDGFGPRSGSFGMRQSSWTTAEPGLLYWRSWPLNASSV